MPYQSYSLAAGLNQAGSLQNVETVFPRFQNHPLIVQGRGRFEAGIRRENAESGIYVTGVQKFTWLVPVMSLAQFAYAKATYSTDDDAYSGPVTVRTRNRSDAYANYSAIMRLPLESELERRESAFLNVVITFVVRAAL